MATMEDESTDLNNQHCFVCGLSKLASLTQPRRRYSELTTIFKALLTLTPLRDKIPPLVYDNFTTNVETCADCLTTIKEVCALRQEIVTLQTELDGLLDRARIKLTNYPEKIIQKDSRGRKRRNSFRAITDEEVVQIKEEFEDVEYFCDNGGEILPDDSLGAIDLEQSTQNDAQDDDEFANISPEPLINDDDGDPDYSPSIRNNSDKSFNCAKCGKLFTKLSHVVRHEVEVCKIPVDKTRSRMKFHECDQCDRSFSSRIQLTRHAISEHNAQPDMHHDDNSTSSTPDGDISQNKDLCCSKCGKVFSTRAHRVRHEIEVCKLSDRDSTRLKFHSCGQDECDRKFSSKTDLTRHWRSSHNLDEDAIREFTQQQEAASSPKAVITPQKDTVGLHPCSKCGKVLTKFLNRISHEVTVCKIPYTDEELTQMGAKFHSCDQCEKKFMNRKDLISHQLIHTGDKPFQCQACGKAFTQSSQLYLHRRTRCEKSLKSSVVKKQEDQV